MILLAPHLMAAEPWFLSDREIQKLDIYFTDYTLTGQPGAYRFWKNRRRQEIRRPSVGVSVQGVASNALAHFFHRLHFDWTTRSCPFQESAAGLRFG
jgi:hypothetical protein